MKRTRREKRLSRHRMRKRPPPHMLSKPGDMIPLSRPEHEIKMDYPSIVSDFNLSLGVAAAVFVALVGFLGIAWNDPKLAPRTVSGIHMVAPFVAIPVILLIVRVVRRAARLIGHQRHRKMHQLLTVASLVILFYSVGVATSWFFWMMDDIETRYPSTPMPPDLM